MPNGQQNQKPTADLHQTALQKVSLLHQLTMESILSQKKQELIFRILNRTVALCAYDRAVIWDFTKPKPKLLGVSGQTGVSSQSELAVKWRKLINGLEHPDRSGVLRADSFAPEKEYLWDSYHESAPHPEVLWLPITHKNTMLAGLWVERWNRVPWREPDHKLLKSLMVSYGAVWGKLDPPSRMGNVLRRTLREGALFLMLAIAALLWFVHVPLRVVGECEVAPRDPIIITAPVDGVVEEVMVQPGQAVQKGDLLFRYDKRVTLEDLKVARKQVEIIQSNLNRASMQAFYDPKARAEIEMIQLELEQEKARVELAEYKASKMDVYAETTGRIVSEDPDEWRGKPVAVGQKVLMIVDPAKTKLRIWLPPDDNVPFVLEKPAQVHLNAFPEKTLTAQLSYVADSVSTSPEGNPAILAEGAWLHQVPDLKIGLQGHATLFGNTVRLGYWLFRKPIAWARMTFGF